MRFATKLWPLLIFLTEEPLARFQGRLRFPQNTGRRKMGTLELAFIPTCGCVRTVEGGDLLERNKFSCHTPHRNAESQVAAFLGFGSGPWTKHKVGRNAAKRHSLVTPKRFSTHTWLGSQRLKANRLPHNWQLKFSGAHDPMKTERPKGSAAVAARGQAGDTRQAALHFPGPPTHMHHAKATERKGPPTLSFGNREKVV